jgi:hypothetical protein
MKKFVWSLILFNFFSLFLHAQNTQNATKKTAKANVQNDKNKCFMEEGIVGLNVTFRTDGNAQNITPVLESPNGLAEQAMETAKKTELTPSKENSVPIDVTKTVEYKFTTYCAKSDDRADAVVQKAVQRLGGQNYLNVKTVTGRGNFSQIKENEGAVVSEFVDYIVYPNKERTEFKSNGVRTIQTNVGDAGWIADTAARTIKEQTAEQIANFKFGIRTSLDNLLRGNWRSETGAKLEYVGRRAGASLGHRNEVVRLTYQDGLTVEFEFAATDGTPAKLIYKRLNSAEETTSEEDRFAQFVEFNRVFAPLIIDHYRNGKQTSRINFQSVEFNAPLLDTLFAKPIDIKKLK